MDLISFMKDCLLQSKCGVGNPCDDCEKMSFEEARDLGAMPGHSRLPEGWRYAQDEACLFAPCSDCAVERPHGFLAKLDFLSAYEYFQKNQGCCTWDDLERFEIVEEAEPATFSELEKNELRQAYDTYVQGRVAAVTQEAELHRELQGLRPADAEMPNGTYSISGLADWKIAKAESAVLNEDKFVKALYDLTSSPFISEMYQHVRLYGVSFTPIGSDGFFLPPPDSKKIDD